MRYERERDTEESTSKSGESRKLGVVSTIHAPFARNTGGNSLSGSWRNLDSRGSALCQSGLRALVADDRNGVQVKDLPTRPFPRHSDLHLDVHCCSPSCRGDCRGSYLDGAHRGEAHPLNQAGLSPEADTPPYFTGPLALKATFVERGAGFTFSACSTTAVPPPSKRMTRVRLPLRAPIS